MAERLAIVFFPHDDSTMELGYYPTSRSIKLQRGFSLLELLLSMAISSLLLVLLATLLSSTLNQWQRDTNKFQKNVEGGAALDLLTRDLQAIVQKSDGSEWLQVSPIGVEGLGNMPWLTFLSTSQDQGEVGDHGSGVCAVSYRLAKMTLPGSSGPVHALYREVLPPDETIEFIGAENLMADIWDDLAGETTEIDSLVALYVVDFDLTFIIETPAGATRSISPVSLRLKKDAPDNSDFPTGSMVRSLQIRMTALDRDGQNRLNEGSLSLNEVKTQHGHDFRAFIEFPTLLP